MKNLNKLGVGLAAVVLAVAAAGGAWAMWGGDDDGGSPTQSERQVNPEDDGGDAAGATCLEGTTDCQDDPSNGGSAAGSTCLVGAADCADNPGVATGGGMAMCVQDHPDCNDMIIGEGGDCAQDQVCTEPDVICDTDGCSQVNCGVAPVDGEPTLTPEEYERALKACEENQPAPCDDTPASAGRCLPPDCSVSSDGQIACPEPVEGDGTGQSEPGSVPPSAGTGAGIDPVAPAAER
jgi:hypothetical protein